MGQFMLDQGVPAEGLHRVAAIASGGLDTLPHNGAVLAMMAVWGSNHRESYRHIFVTSVFIPIFATIIAVIMANIMYPIVPR
jgi:H+/gluconate symporter-like permease